MDTDNQNPSRETDDMDHVIGHTIPVEPKPVVTSDHPDNWVQVKGARKGIERNVVTKRMRNIAAAPV